MGNAYRAPLTVRTDQQRYDGLVTECKHWADRLRVMRLDIDEAQRKLDSAYANVVDFRHKIP